MTDSRLPVGSQDARPEGTIRRELMDSPELESLVADFDALVAERDRYREALEVMTVAVESYIAYDSQHQRRIDTKMLTAALAAVGEPALPAPVPEGVEND